MFGRVELHGPHQQREEPAAVQPAHRPLQQLEFAQVGALLLQEPIGLLDEAFTIAWRAPLVRHRGFDPLALDLSVRIRFAISCMMR